MPTIKTDNGFQCMELEFLVGGDGVMVTIYDVYGSKSVSVDTDELQSVVASLDVRPDWADAPFLKWMTPDGEVINTLIKAEDDSWISRVGSSWTYDELLEY